MLHCTQYFKISKKCTKKSDEQPECFFAYETSCLFGDLAAIAVAIAKSS